MPSFKLNRRDSISVDESSCRHQSLDNRLYTPVELAFIRGHVTSFSILLRAGCDTTRLRLADLHAAAAATQLSCTGPSMYSGANSPSSSSECRSNMRAMLRLISDTRSVTTDSSSVTSLKRLCRRPALEAVLSAARYHRLPVGHVIARLPVHEDVRRLLNFDELDRHHQLVNSTTTSSRSTTICETAHNTQTMISGELLAPNRSTTTHRCSSAKLRSKATTKSPKSLTSKCDVNGTPNINNYEISKRLSSVAIASVDSLLSEVTSSTGASLTENKSLMMRTTKMTSRVSGNGCATVSDPSEERRKLHPFNSLRPQSAMGGRRQLPVGRRPTSPAVATLSQPLHNRTNRKLPTVPLSLAPNISHNT